ncbi:MAG: bile acid:sodium symporter [Syntrophorhabdaceae bacterium]|nr:bile acid:sodium symporter [Syntrophorhabdaceae bacterium]
MITIETLTKVLNIVILIFLVSTMLSVGLSLTVRQIIGPLRNARLFISSFVSCYILVPAIAIAVTRLFGLDEPLKVGLVLFSMAAGAEAGPKLAGIAKANVAFSVGLLVASLCISVLFIPLVLNLLLPETRIATGKLLIKLLLGVGLPLSIGLILKARCAAVADRISPYIHKVSSIFMILMAIGIVGLNIKEIAGLFGSGTIGAAIVFIAGSVIIGYLLGGPGRDNRWTLAFMSGGRNASISLVIASQVFTDPKVLLMITVTVVLQLVLILPLSLYVGRRSASPQVG